MEANLDRNVFPWFLGLLDFLGVSGFFTDIIEILLSGKSMSPSARRKMWTPGMHSFFHEKKARRAAASHCYSVQVHRTIVRDARHQPLGNSLAHKDETSRPERVYLESIAPYLFSLPQFYEGDEVVSFSRRDASTSNTGPSFLLFLCVSVS